MTENDINYENEDRIGYFEPMQDNTEYTSYFNQLNYMLSLLAKVFLNVDESQQNYEQESVLHFFQKLLYSIKAMRMKHTYNMMNELTIDLSNSGFPTYQDICSLNVDFRLKNERLEEIAGFDDLIYQLTNALIKDKNPNPAKELSLLSERRYYEMLDPRKLFFTFTPGKLVHNDIVLRNVGKRSKEYRSYSYSWACYDSSTNRPYIYIITFDQNIESKAFEEHDFNYRTFLDVISKEGSYAPNLLVVAAGVDKALDDIHPKRLKRICVGPICSLNYSKDPEDIYEVLHEYAENNDDCVLFYDVETVVSVQQTVSKSMFSQGKTREVYFVPETDLECSERGTSQVTKYILAPHSIIQHMDFTDKHQTYANHISIAYDAKGEIYVDKRSVLED